MRCAIAVLLPLLAGALVYAGLALGGTPGGWIDSSMLLLPALLIGVMLIAVVFLPLWSVLAHRTTRVRTAFVCIAVAILAAICGGLSALGAFEGSRLESVGLLFVPGLVLVTTFGTLMDTRRVRGGEKPDPKRD